MSALLVDTHALVWFVTAPQKLSERARSELVAADAIWVSAISLVEVVYLAEKGRVPAELHTRLASELDSTGSPLRLVPVDRAVVDRLGDVPRDAVPDMPDRLLAASALALGLPLVTCDGCLTASSIETVW